MSVKQRFGLIMTIFWGLAFMTLLVRMIVCGDFRLWAVELAILCAIAVSLRMYALEWRRLRDKKEEQL